MMDKRMSKLDVALEEIPNEDKAIAYGQDDPSGWNYNGKLGIYQGSNSRCNGSVEQQKGKRSNLFKLD